jgi:hypothetical protein
MVEPHLFTQLIKPHTFLKLPIFNFSNTVDDTLFPSDASALIECMSDSCEHLIRTIELTYLIPVVFPCVHNNCSDCAVNRCTYTKADQENWRAMDRIADIVGLLYSWVHL